MKGTWLFLLLAAVLTPQTTAPRKAPARATTKSAQKIGTQKSEEAAKKAPAPAASVTEYDLALKIPPRGIVKLPPFEQFSLDNGLRILLNTDHELPQMHGTLLVRAGRIHAPDGMQAVPQMVADALRAGGTRGFVGQKFDDRLTELGAKLQFDVGPVVTTIRFSAPSASAEKVIELVQKLLTEPAYPLEAIEAAQAHVHTLVDRRNNDLLQSARNNATRPYFSPATPFFRPLEHEGIDGIGREELRDFQTSWYLPSNAVLAVSGDISRQNVLTLSNWPRGTLRPEPKLLLAPPKATTLYVANLNKSGKGAFVVAMLAGRPALREVAAFHIAAELFGRGFDTAEQNRQSSWELVFDNHLEPLPTGDSVFQIRGTTRASTLTGSIQIAMRELSRLTSGDFTNQQLAQAKDQYLRKLAERYPYRKEILEDAAQLLLDGMKPESGVQVWQESLLVTKADITKALHLLKPSQAVVSVIGETFGQLQPFTDLRLPTENIETSIAAARPVPPRSDAAGLEQARRWLTKLRGAMGGDTKVSQIRSFRATLNGTVRIREGIVPVSFSQMWIAPNVFRQEQTLPSGKVTAFYDGKIGWLSANQNIAALLSHVVGQLQGNLFRLPWQIGLSGTDPKITLGYLGSGTVLIQDDSGNSVRAFLDEETGLLLRTRYTVPQASGSPTQVEDRFSEWVDAGAGLQIPTRIVTFQGGYPVRDLKMERFEINGNLTIQEIEKKP